MEKQRTKRRTIRGTQLGRLSAMAVLMQLQGCAYQPVTPDSGAMRQVSDDVQECRDMLGSRSADGSELNASSISLLNWNVRKKRARGWSTDFDTFADGADLVLFQEASIREETINEIDASRHWSFAPGYSTMREITGVMTLSGARPLTQCSFVHVEPWLRTPKATSITEYGLSGIDGTLVVVNVHAVNFSFGTGVYEQQFAEIRQVLEQHDGPIILSGDMNTWRGKRTKIVEELAASLQLVPVDFENDHRVRFFGSALDHIYVRGLRTLDASTEIVDTSDHNPMIAVLGL